MADPSFFDWECFEHIDDFTYCLSRVWVILLVIYLVTAVLFGLAAGTIIWLRRRQRKRYQEHAAEYLWGLVVPAFLLLVILVIILFIIIRKVAKRKRYSKLLEDTYGISEAPSKKSEPLDEENDMESIQNPEIQV